ncbi:molybdopterin-guanine dinucleotide biosynthesis protein B [Sporosarcina koreensis]|uniref:molybdopterin-guanine dinucleotide biosynthesis protein B n=1 Tax=Sporosarcina koreensis TaxID=334735 RepID=UPI00058FDC5A|nr:molybdopterin-guanine dinucleotide biosynthesis protein B [Sporosarcina koreensis]
MKTLHIAGYKNSGKTTLLERWIGIAKQAGRSVAVLKHHGHGGPVELPPVLTDTTRFFRKGADASLAAGGGTCQLLLNSEPDFETLKQLAAQGKPDILLIEGYKEETGDKVILVREPEDWETLQHLDGIRLIVGPLTSLSAEIIPSREDTAQLDSWFARWLAKEELDETV